MKQRLQSIIILCGIAVILLSACGSGDGDSPTVIPNPEPSVNIHGVWQGSIVSLVDSSSTEYTVIADGSKIYFVDYHGDSAIGELHRDGDFLTATMKIYSHFPANLSQAIKNPALGAGSTRNLQIDIYLTDSDITGSYKVVEAGQTQDTGNLAFIKRSLSETPPSSIGIRGTYSDYEFTCGQDSGYSLYCYSYLSAGVDASHALAGTYEDKFLYSPRPPSIPSSIPSSFSFTGTLTKRVGVPGLYGVVVALPGYGTVEGVGWKPENSRLFLITVTLNGEFVFRIG